MSKREWLGVLRSRCLLMARLIDGWAPDGEILQQFGLIRDALGVTL